MFKKAIVGLLSLLLVFGVLSSVSAQPNWLPKAGITPDSPFYFLDKWGEGIGMAFAFSPEAKANKALRYSEERLAEMEKVSEKGKVPALERATERYEHYLNLVETKQNQSKGKKKMEVTERVASSTSKHLSALEDISDKVPKQARQGIENARDKSKQGHIRALESLSKERPEQAVKIGSNSLQKRLERTKKIVEQNRKEELDSSLQDFEEIREKVEKFQRDDIELKVLGSKGKVNQVKALEEIEDKAGQMPEKSRQDLKKLKEEVHQQFNQSLSKIAEEQPEQATKFNLEVVDNKVQQIKQKGEQMKEKAQRCEGECEQICKNEEVESCVTECAKAAECKLGDQQCLDGIQQMCEGACQSKADLAKCVSNCNQACTHEAEREMEQDIKEFKEQNDFGKEISNMAGKIGKGEVEVEELVGKATSHHLEVLNKVYEKVPEEAKPAIRRAREVSTQGRERAMEALQKQAREGSTKASEALERVRQKTSEGVTPGPEGGEEPGPPGSTETPSSEDEQPGEGQSGEQPDQGSDSEGTGTSSEKQSGQGSEQVPGGDQSEQPGTQP